MFCRIGLAPLRLVCRAAAEKGSCRSLLAAMPCAHHACKAEGAGHAAASPPSHTFWCCVPRPCPAVQVTVAKQVLPPGRRHFDVVVACEDEEGEDLDVPLVSIRFK
eukprot:GHRQ01021466.1.p2 GENE.GHRQ01021466.1~~GHRQ01021466.1.p2  ORF type:complete len:106 (+),score=18.45 GHRQ01021466.1:180-497(+)